MSYEICGNCGGNGSRFGGATCGVCHGSGEVWWDEPEPELEDDTEDES